MNNNSGSSKFFTYFTFVEDFSSKVIGLAPWTIRSSKIFDNNLSADNRRSKFEYKPSVAGSFYNILLITFLVLFNIFVVSDIAQETNLTIPAIAAYKVAYVSIFGMSVIVLIYVFRQKLLIVVKNRLQDIDEKLQSCAGYQLENDKINYWIFFSNLAIMCVWLIFRLFKFPILKIITMNLPTQIGSCLMIQYAMMINTMKKRFKSINATLSKLGNSSLRKTLDDIISLKYAYVELCDLCDKTADFYGIPTLITMISYAAKNVLCIYFMILMFLGEVEGEIGLYLSGLFAIHTMFLFTLLTTSVTKIIKQNKETKRIINKLLDRFAANEEITDKLSIFSNDLWHLKVEFTLFDIISIDRSLLTVISGTTVTYLVILIQFYFTKTN